jgi:hypothetical protein
VGDRARDDAEAHDLGVGKQTFEIDGVLGVRGGESSAVEGCCGGVDQR